MSNNCAHKKRRGIDLSFLSALLGQVQFVDFLGGKSQLGDDVGIAGGVAVEGVCLRGNVEAVFLPEPVEIVFHMEAVHALGRTVDVVILAPVVAVQGEAGFKIVVDPGLAQGDKAVTTGEGIDFHFAIVAVSAVDDLLANLFLLPLEPIGNVGEFGFAFRGLQLAVLLKEPMLAAVVAEDFCALGSHLELGVAMGALIEDLLQAFSTVYLGNEDVVFQLVAVLVILHGGADDGIDLIGGHVSYLLGSEHLTEGGVEGNFPLVGVSPEGRVEVVAVMGYHHQGDLVHLHQTAQGIGQVRGGADGGVPCLGIHAQNVAVLKNFADGLDQVDVIGEFPGADGADPGQKPGHLVIAVDVDHVVYGMRGGHHGR